MFWSIFMNGVLGYIMVILILVAMPSVEDALNSSSPIIAILQSVTGSNAATTAMVTGLFVISFSINLANIASVSRLTWACGRDGVLPKQLAYVGEQDWPGPLMLIVLG
jgi:choline transport protein